VGIGAFAQGFRCVSYGVGSNAMGTRALATDSDAHAEGYETTASGESSHAEGWRTKALSRASHAEGWYTQAKEQYSHAEGYETTAEGKCSHASGCCTIANSYQFVTGAYNTPTNGVTSPASQSEYESLFIVGCGTSAENTANAFRISGTGKCYGAHDFTGSGADFAEYFEWLDGNPNNEDRRGRIVTLDRDKIRFATAEDDYLLGVVSGSGCFIGNSQSEDWQGKYLKDVFGKILVKEVEIPEKTVEEKTLVEDADGNLVEQVQTKVIPAHTVQQLAINPDYNPEQEYVSREFRKEWSAVGFHGQIVVVDDGTC
jgi:hypothetical protein